MGRDRFPDDDARGGEPASLALCVVNTKRAARELFETLSSRQSGNIFHLSTWMCPKHRIEILDVVKTRLKEKQPCYLVSTQLIEAGVDVDFPLGFANWWDWMQSFKPLAAVTAKGL